MAGSARGPLFQVLFMPFVDPPERTVTRQQPTSRTEGIGMGTAGYTPHKGGTRGLDTSGRQPFIREAVLRQCRDITRRYGWVWVPGSRTLCLGPADWILYAQGAAYWTFATDAGMVPQVAEPALPATVTAVTRVVQAMVPREGARMDWTPNTLVEQRVHHNTNKAQQTRREVHPPLWDKEGTLQPHSPWMVHSILQDHGDNRKGTKVHLTHSLAHTHIQYAVPNSSAVVNYGAAQKFTYRLLPNTEGTAYTVYTWAGYNDLPGPTWHPDPAWHRPLHGRHVPRQGGKKPRVNTLRVELHKPDELSPCKCQDAPHPHRMTHP